VVQTKFDPLLIVLNDGLARQADPVSHTWLSKVLIKLADISELHILTNFSQISRYFTQTSLNLTQTDYQVIAAINETWQLSHWTLRQTACTVYLMALAVQRPSEFKAWLLKLLSSANLQELTAIYQGLALLPEPVSFIAQAKEGVRSNISALFNAVALNNPYPACYFETDSWNQLILKAIFIESDLQAIIGLEQRANPELSRMLLDYACERHAANRPITKVLWRLAGLGADQAVAQRLQSLAETDKPLLQQGAKSALAAK